jgi:hypothetical protein
MVDPFISCAKQPAGRTKHGTAVNINCSGLYAADEKKHENTPFLLMFCAGYGIKNFL